MGYHRYLRISLLEAAMQQVHATPFEALSNQQRAAVNIQRHVRGGRSRMRWQTMMTSDSPEAAALISRPAAGPAVTKPNTLAPPPRKGAGQAKANISAQRDPNGRMAHGADRRYKSTWTDLALKFDLAEGSPRPPLLRVELWDDDAPLASNPIAVQEVRLPDGREGVVAPLTLLGPAGTSKGAVAVSFSYNIVCAG